MVKTLKNSEMVNMRKQLKPMLSKRNIIGYVAARNYRKITEALTEYDTFKNNLIEKYGEPDKDANGNQLQTVSLKIDSPEFDLFMRELEPLNNVEQEINIMTMEFDKVIGELSGEEILSIDWMLED